MSSWDDRNWVGGLIVIILIASQIIPGPDFIRATQAAPQTAHNGIVAEVTEFGFYRALQATVRKPNNQLPSGYERTGGKVALARQTQQIPLIKDLLFGFKFRIRGFPKDQVAAQLVLKVSHPQMTRPDGSKRDNYSYPVLMNVRSGEINDKTGYRFDNSFEMVAGEWRFEYWYQDSLLLSQSFTAVKVDDAKRREVEAALRAPPADAPETSQAVTTDESTPTVQPKVSPVPQTQVKSQAKPQSQPQPQPQPQKAASTPTAPQPVEQVRPVTAEKDKQTVPKPAVSQKNPAATAEAKSVSDKLSPTFQKQIQSIMEQYKAMNYGDRLIPDNNSKKNTKKAPANGPVPAIQTGAGKKATETVQQNPAAAQPANVASPVSTPQDGVAQSSESRESSGGSETRGQ